MQDCGSYPIRGKRSSTFATDDDDDDGQSISMKLKIEMNGRPAPAPISRQKIGVAPYSSRQKTYSYYLAPFFGKYLPRGDLVTSPCHVEDLIRILISLPPKASAAKLSRNSQLPLPTHTHTGGGTTYYH